jgi:hypothetical protein
VERLQPRTPLADTVGIPTPTPRVTLLGGPLLVSVIATDPACVAVNE